MQVFYGIGQLARRQKSLKKVVAAIGVFDGIHVGHRRIIETAVAQAKRLGGMSAVVTFDPHPVKVLHPERFSSYLTTLDQRLRFISALGVDVCLVARFTRRFATMSPATFIGKYLVRHLDVVQVIVGEDFHFGSGRTGSLKILKEQGARYGFRVEAVALVKDRHAAVKSSLIREQTRRGKVERARQLLGRPITIRGVVVHGDARGRRLGFPTANVRAENVIIPPPGIYVARVLHAGRSYGAALYIGRRPSFDTDHSITIEAFLLNFKGSLYGKTIDVQLLKKVREDRKFSDEKSLIRQIGLDVNSARSYFRAHRS